MEEKKEVDKLLRKHFFGTLKAYGWKKYKSSFLVRLADDRDIGQFIYLQKSTYGGKFSVTLYFKSLGRLIDESILPGCRLGFLVNGTDKWYTYDEGSIAACVSDLTEYGNSFFAEYSSKSRIIDTFKNRRNQQVLPHSSRMNLEMVSYSLAIGDTNQAYYFLEASEKLIKDSHFKYDDEIDELNQWKVAMNDNSAKQLVQDNKIKNLERLGIGGTT